MTPFRPARAIRVSPSCLLCLQVLNSCGKLHQWHRASWHPPMETLSGSPLWVPPSQTSPSQTLPPHCSPPRPPSPSCSSPAVSWPASGETAFQGFSSAGSSPGWHPLVLSAHCRSSGGCKQSALQTEHQLCRGICMYHRGVDLAQPAQCMVYLTEVRQKALCCDAPTSAGLQARPWVPPCTSRQRLTAPA